jgi:hypothetical protein
MRPGSRFQRLPLLVLGGFLTLALAAPRQVLPSPATRILVVCSPGSPGDTEQAQPTMDAFAKAAARSAGWPEGSLQAVYFEAAEPGLARLRSDAVLALVPPAFLSRYGKELALTPRLEAVLDSGKPETWSLVAAKGRITSPDSLKGWEVTGAPGFAPNFVRGDLFKDWGKLPSDLQVTFTPRPLTALKRASEGEKVAVVLDSAGTAALPSLPFAAKLEVAARSHPLPGALLCTVGNRLPASEAESLVKGLARLGEKQEGAEVLQSMRLSKFAAIGKKRPPQAATPSRKAPPPPSGS